MNIIGEEQRKHFLTLCLKTSGCEDQLEPNQQLGATKLVFTLRV